LFAALGGFGWQLVRLIGAIEVSNAWHNTSATAFLNILHIPFMKSQKETAVTHMKS
jgi:hypothetical protein